MGIKSILDDVVIMLLWTGDMLATHNLDRLTEPFETWERRQGLHLQLKRMEARKVIEQETKAGQIVYNLTELGRLEALGGRDIISRWNRPWDGRWRQLLFDLPVRHRKARIRLWRWLRQNHFGYLQHSVWIHPDPLTDITTALRPFHSDVETTLVMESVATQEHTNAAIVLGAWDFDEVNKRYQHYIDRFESIGTALDKVCQTAENLGNWLRNEKVAWKHAVALDPLLPESLWPKGYRGKRAWETRRDLYQRIARTVAS